jgi:hypothetical protein
MNIEILYEFFFGASVGFEILNDPEVLCEGEEWTVIIDLFVFRVIVTSLE